MKKKLLLLGSTGSIGRQTLSVVDHHQDEFEIEALAAYRSVEEMAAQVARYRPRRVCMVEAEAARRLAGQVDVPVLSGEEGLLELCDETQADIALDAVVGIAGLQAVMRLIDRGVDIALANKEALVTGGALVMEAVRRKNVKLLPVDSEHSAIFQCLQGSPEKGAVKKLILTASGGPFFGKTLAELENVTAADALKHPNWDMGAKITIDSATMMNKGLEFIEAKWLFDMPIDAIDIVVHRESVVHSAIAYQDNSVIAQLGVPDMRIPIQYALTYPRRLPSPVQELSLVDYGKLTFYAPDYDTFRCINVCKDAIAAGGLRPAAANGANEESVRLFLNGKIKFTDIAVLNRAAMEACPQVADYTLDDVLQADRAARDYVIEAVS